jgi:hypothetical protein
MSIKSLFAVIAALLISGSAVAADAAGGARMLFAHSPGCSHCAYQRPVVNKFSTAHKELKVTRAVYSKLTASQERLIEGTSGHPVMVFYTKGGDCKRQVVGETPLADLEKEYDTFKQQCLKAAATGSTTRGGSNIICR